MPTNPHSGDPEHLVRSAVYALDRGNISEAQRIVTEHITPDTKHHHVFFERSRVLWLLRENSEALNLAHAALESDRSNWHYLLCYGLVKHSLGAHAEGTMHIRRSRGQRTVLEYQDLLRDNATSCFKSGQFGMATFYSSARTFFGWYDYHDYEIMAHSLMSMRLYEFAEEIIRSKIDQDAPYSPHYEDWFSLLEVNLTTERYKEALDTIGTLEAWFEFDSDEIPSPTIEDPDASESDRTDHAESMTALWRELQYLRGLCESKLKRFGVSLKHLENSLSGRRALGNELEGLEDTAFRILRSDRTNAAPIERLKAEVKLRLGDVAGSISDLNNIINAHPDDSSSLYQRAVYYLQTGDRHLAKQDLIRAKGLGDVQSTSLLKDLLESHPLELDEIVDEEHPNVFQKEEDQWLLRYDGHKPIVLGNSRGLQYIRELLANPFEEVSAASLALRDKANIEMDSGLSGSGQTLDRKKRRGRRKLASQEYKDGMEELEEDLERATSIEDREEIEERIRKIKGMMIRDTFEESNPDDTKAANTVRNSCKRAIEKIRGIDERIADHLETSLRFGLRVSYWPRKATTWVT